ncbi:hypothetical protein [Butyrivibrio proteoclasticus]|uniref:hypothetical protein n=1 Tax=Butyrivibrio proteoclasticus TaxID=43305 RepID=UPI00047948EC|nr:hypothetical protein [Butyrivibrio proteoclasticus]
MPSGYYDGVTITNDVTSAGGTVTYFHHVHSLTSPTESIATDSAAVTTDGLDDDYHADEPSGCYSVAYYKHVTNYGAQCNARYSYTRPNGKTQDDYHGNCNHCGRDLCVNGHSGWASCSNCNKPTYDTNPENGIFAYYGCACGYTKGQIVKVEIAY